MLNRYLKVFSIDSNALIHTPGFHEAETLPDLVIARRSFALVEFLDTFHLHFLKP